MSEEKHAGGRPLKPILKTSMPPVNGVYYTIHEAEDITKLHRNTLERYLMNGRLKGKKVYGTWRIYKEELFDISCKGTGKP